MFKMSLLILLVVFGKLELTLIWWTEMYEENEIKRLKEIKIDK